MASFSLFSRMMIVVYINMDSFTEYDEVLFLFQCKGLLMLEKTILFPTFSKVTLLNEKC